MTRQRKSNATAAASSDITYPIATNSRRRSIPTVSSNTVPRGTKEINAAPMLEKNARPGIDPNGGMTVSRAIAMAGIMINSALPMLVSWGLTLSLIFGGCCSNVGRQTNQNSYKRWLSGRDELIEERRYSP